MKLPMVCQSPKGTPGGRRETGVFQGSLLSHITVQIGSTLCPGSGSRTRETSFAP